jgi:hypothetical protein
MRAIKFRAWDRKNEEMRDWHYLCWNWSMGTLNGDSNTDVMQFTGLKDKNDVEIYEGELIVTDPLKPNSKTLYTGAVEYHGRGFNVMVPNYGLVDFYEGCAEIIGNIYENSDLLKNKPPEGE